MRRILLFALLFLGACAHSPQAPTPPTPEPAECTGSAEYQKALADLEAVIAKGTLPHGHTVVICGEDAKKHVRYTFDDDDPVIEEAYLGECGRIRILRFHTWRTSSETLSALRRLRAQDINCVFLDLRGARGGSPWPALAIAYAFSKDPDAITVTFVYEGGKERVLSQSHPLSSSYYPPDGLIPPEANVAEMGEFAGINMVIGTDGGTASSSEILVGILKEWGFRVVGARTGKKGTQQQRDDYGNGVVLMLTTAEFFIGPDRVKVEGVGIPPTYRLYNTSDEYMLPKVEELLEHGEIKSL